MNFLPFPVFVDSLVSLETCWYSERDDCSLASRKQAEKTAEFANGKQQARAAKTMETLGSISANLALSRSALGLQSVCIWQAIAPPLARIRHMVACNQP